jgi:hypothetical protein
MLSPSLITAFYFRASSCGRRANYLLTLSSKPPPIPLANCAIISGVISQEESTNAQIWSATISMSLSTPFLLERVGVPPIRLLRFLKWTRRVWRCNARCCELGSNARKAIVCRSRSYRSSCRLISPDASSSDVRKRDASSAVIEENDMQGQPQYAAGLV